MEQIENQRVPVRMWRQMDRLTVAAPMPGLEPEDITVEISADGRLTIYGDLRGVFKDDKEVLLNEWTIGHYRRDLDLPNSVDGTMTNVTYGNGVLVIAMPVSDTHQPARLTLETTGQARGQRVGHAGSDVMPHSTEEHQDAIADQHRQVGQ